MNAFKLILLMFFLMFNEKELLSQPFNLEYIINTNEHGAVNFDDINFDINSNSFINSYRFISVSTGIIGSGIIQIDINGVIQKNNLVYLSNKSASNSVSKLLHNEYFLATTYSDTNVFSIHRFNSNLQKLDSSIVNFEDYGVSFSINFIDFLNEDKVLIGGELSTSNFFNTSLAIIFVLNRNYEIVNHVIQNNSMWNDSFNDIVVNDSNNIIWVSGVTYDNNLLDLVSFGDPFIIKFDTSWNKKNFKYYKDSLQINSTYKLSQYNNSIFLASAKGVLASPNSGDLQIPELIEINSNGEKTWNYTTSLSGATPYNHMVDVKITNNGSIYSLGYEFTTTDLDSISVPSGTVKWEYMQLATLYKWDQNRNLKWIRHIRHPHAISFNSNNKPVELTVLPDNSIVFSGTYTPGSFDQGIQKQVGWVVKTDSNGCIYGDTCFNFLSVKNNLQLNNTPFQTFPNPVDDLLYTKSEFTKKNVVHIFTVAGELVFISSFKNNQLKLPQLTSNNLFIIKVFDNNQLYHSTILTK